MLDSDFEDNNSVQFTAGSVIYNYNDESDCAYLLKKERLKLFQKKEQQLVLSMKRKFLVNNLYFLILKRTVTAKAVKDCLAIKNSKKYFTE